MLLTLLGGLAGLSAGLLAWQALAPAPVAALGIEIDRLSAAIGLLVAGVGAATYRFALRYLDGEPGQRRFLRWLAATVGTAYLLVLASNLLLLFCAWALTSLGLHQLLTFYRDRPAAQVPARKKFLISRLGDLALLAAIGLIWAGWGTLDIRQFLAHAAAPGGWAEPTTVALLIAAAALTKSAQFPFHSWLPETMEAPTPVSALMHAGIINAGGVLLLRFAPLIAAAPAAQLLLALIGTITAALGLLAMWAQVDVKRTLAWSTVGQMGFMIVQCGLLAFPAAALHIAGHGCYKAWAFLRAGGLLAPAPPRPTLEPGRALGLALAGTALAAPALALAARLTGFAPLHSPGELALTAILALSIGQLWTVLLRDAVPPKRLAARAGGAWLIGLLASCAALALYRGAAVFLAPVLGDLPAASGPLTWTAAVLPVLAFAGLAIVRALMPALQRTAAGRALRIHSLHGFYIGEYASRLTERIWGLWSAAPIGTPARRHEETGTFNLTTMER
jgi:NAD(P)H-quinone oxidoreductase subunit 5